MNLNSVLDESTIIFFSVNYHTIVRCLRLTSTAVAPKTSRKERRKHAIRWYAPMFRSYGFSVEGLDLACAST